MEYLMTPRIAAICSVFALLNIPAIAQDKTPSSTAENDPVVDEDNVADDLNSRQQLQQSFTLKRTIGGEVVQTEQRTVTYDRSLPYRDTEAGQSVSEVLRAAFDGELLTRSEALEEAKLDFSVADRDRDGAMTLNEYFVLAESWREDAESDQKTTRQRQFDAFLAELEGELVPNQKQAAITEKFQFMAGADGIVKRADYLRGYLRDFDTLDVDNNSLLDGNELINFRALSQGPSSPERQEKMRLNLK